jgi:cytoskeletal protein CcmA (bactofilin family)
MERPMAEVRIKDIDEHEIDTILAEDIDFEGHLSFKKPLMIKGKFKGEISSTSSLYIGEKAYVEASTEAAVVSSKGTHKGNIVGHSRVELFNTARVEGDITTPDFIMESGSRFNGYCNMGGAKKEGQSTAQHAAPSANGGGSSPAASPAQHPQSQQQSQQQKPNTAPQGQPQPPQGSGQQPQGQAPQAGQPRPPAPPAGQGGSQK